MSIREVLGLLLDGLFVRQARLDDADPTIALSNVAQGLLRACRAQAGTGEFLRFDGPPGSALELVANDLRAARVPWRVSPGLRVRSTADIVHED